MQLGNKKFREAPVSLDLLVLWHQGKRTGTYIEVIGSVGCSLFFFSSRDFYFTGARESPDVDLLQKLLRRLRFRDCLEQCIPLPTVVGCRKEKTPSLRNFSLDNRD